MQLRLIARDNVAASVFEGLAHHVEIGHRYDGVPHRVERKVVVEIALRRRIGLDAYASAVEFQRVAGTAITPGEKSLSVEEDNADKSDIELGFA